ncbi:5-oxoprolinase subunit PxpA [uncultured Algibacter sp.]|uniref:5-oxoprolinase subunit PxpA n=1 Tax=uncultured Algibacter sp. TaxID=298659 RepID=UPI0026327411|nr:5-oxoprolinase subunit PxpA [uncultured Algibacter sp.]
MESLIIDINVDTGEGIGNESQIMPYVSACNIACGGHAGDGETMRNAVKLAKQYGVKIGAHPSFPDKENFGRTRMDISCVALYTSIKNQIKDLVTILNEEHAALHHIKPHGALYNLAAVDEKVANVIVEAVKALAIPVKLYVPFNSVIANVAIKNNIQIIYEAFADRNYNDDLTLVSRNESNALISNSDLMFEHINNIILNKKVKTISGNFVPLKAETFCIHGDQPDGVNIVSNLVGRLKNKGIKIR